MKRMMMMNKYIISGAIGCLCMACAPKEYLSNNSIKLPDSYSNVDNTDTTTIGKMSWKSFFPDPILQSYIETAIKNNYSFKNAVEHITIARSEVKLKKGAMLPEVSIGALAGIQRFGEYTMDGVGNSTTNTPDLPKSKHIPDPYRNFDLGLNFSWEADIWGKLNSKRKAAVNRWLASVDAVQLAQSILIADLAKNYFDLVALDYQREVISEAIKGAEAALSLSKELKIEGETTQLAVDQFHARVLRLNGELLANESNIKSKERAISILLGSVPTQVKRISFGELRQLNFASEIGIPAQLLTLRPDLRAAEREVIASKYDVKAAKKTFYPSIKLGGSGGFNAFDVSNWFSLPASLTYNLALGLTAPIFNKNEIKVMWENANSQQRIALNSYHNAALNAYQEVSGVFTDCSLVKAQKEFKHEEVRICKNATINANELFSLQYSGYLEVLSAEEQYYDSQIQLIELESMYCKLHADLFRALGGGVY